MGVDAVAPLVEKIARCPPQGRRIGVNALQSAGSFVALPGLQAGVDRNAGFSCCLGEPLDGHVAVEDKVRVEHGHHPIDDALLKPGGP